MSDTDTAKFTYDGVEEVPGDVKEAIVSESVENIPPKAFYYRSFLENVTLSKLDGGAGDSPNPAGKIGKQAFEGCKNLTSVTIEDNCGLITIEEEAFYGCKSLQSIKLPEGLKVIGKMAFHSCTSLKSVTLPDSLMAIGDDAFRGCTALEKVKIPDRVKRIATSAFFGCSSLASVSLPKELKEIGASAFMSCTSLKELNVPQIQWEVKIGKNSFYNTPQLEGKHEEINQWHRDLEQEATEAIKNMDSELNEEASKGDNDFENELWKESVWTEEAEDPNEAQKMSVELDTDDEEEVDPDAGLVDGDDDGDDDGGNESDDNKQDKADAAVENGDNDNDDIDDEEEKKEDDAGEVDNGDVDQDSLSVIAYKESLKGASHYWNLDGNNPPVPEEEPEKRPPYLSRDASYQAGIKPKSTSAMLKKKRLMALNKKEEPKGMQYSTYTPPKTLGLNQNSSKRANMKMPYRKPRKDVLPTWI